MNTLKKIVFTIIFFTLILLVYVLVFSLDAATVEDADLVLPLVVVLEPADNAYYLLPTIDELGGATDRDVTSAFIAASKLPGYQCPTMVNNYSADAEACSLNDLRDLANLVADRSGSSWQAGDTTDAVDSALAILRVAHQLAVSNSMLIEELVAIALYDIAADTLEQLAGKLSPTQNNQVFEALQQYRPDNATLLNAYRAEYMVSKDMINQIGIGNNNLDTGESPGPYRWQPNRTINKLASWYRLVLGIELASNKEMQDKFEKIINISPMILIQPNSTGKIFLAVILESTSKITTRHQQLEQRYDELQTKFAAE